MLGGRNAIALGGLALAATTLLTGVNSYRVDISDTDDLREVCSGMYGGKEAYIELTFNPTSAGQLALVIYEWSDVEYLGAETAAVEGSDDWGMPKTYICTTSAVRSGQCTKSDLGQFITTLPSHIPLNSTSIFTTSLKFEAGSFPIMDPEEGTYESDEDLPVLEELESSTIAEVGPGGALETETEGVAVPTGVYGNEDEGYEGTKTTSKAKISLPTSVAGGFGDETSEETEAEAEAEYEEEEMEEIAEEIAEEEYEEEIEEEIEEAIEEEELEEELEQEEADSLKVKVRRNKSIQRRQKRSLPVLKSGFAVGQHSTTKRSLPVGIMTGLVHGRFASRAEKDKKGWFGSGEPEKLEEVEEEVEELEEEEDEAIEDMIDAVNEDDYEAAADVYEEIVEEEDELISEEEELEEEKQEAEEEEAAEEPTESKPIYSNPYTQEEDDVVTSTTSSHGTRPTSTSSSSSGSKVASAADVPTYEAPIVYAVPKTGYYCIGVVPVTLVNSKRDGVSLIEKRETATHAEYSGSVLFRNTFEGELPAAEYPKIGFYAFLSFVYVLLAAGWGFLCAKHYRELLPMQYYISGTIGFLVIEMIANWGYYRYINKHGGGAGSLAFLLVVATLNAGRNSLSFFLLLIVSMGLSVVTPSLGSVMNKIRILTVAHFIFGVLYAVGVVEVDLESASLFLVLFMIFPLALTLTAFLMWTIISLNGTIIHLAARKQRHKLKMFKSLWRILVIAVIAIAGFFVISSLSLSNRLEEDYAPKSWKYRWVLLDGSLATIYLAVFASISWLWRPSRDSTRFAMSQELAQDEAEADAEDYEIDNLEASRHHRGNYDDDGDEAAGFISKETNGHGEGNIHLNNENVVFALEDEEDPESGGIHQAGGYDDMDAARYKRD